MTCRARFTRRAFGVLTSLLLLPALARAEEPPAIILSGESRAATARLAEARKLLDDKKWPEAVEALQAILNTAGNDLVTLTPAHGVQARRLCQVHLASLPPDALRLYRARAETPARKTLEQAQAANDMELLRKVADEAFCTRAAEKAVDLLGDLAFERGRFGEAEQWWRMLAPLPDARKDQATRGLALVYPEPQGDPARYQAKQLLARLFRSPHPALSPRGRGQGEGSEDWARDLDAFRARHGKAEGALAGRKGRYADLLQTLADERRKEKRADDSDWRTFGGDRRRGRVVPAPDDVLDHLSALCRAGPTWRFNLETRTRQEGPPYQVTAWTGDQTATPTLSLRARSLAFHPILVGDQVLVADARYVTAYDLRTGQSSQWYDVAELNGGVKPNLKLPAPPDLRYTLTAAGDNVYVRLGAQDIGAEPPPVGAPMPGRVPPRKENETFLACLSLRPSPATEGDKGGGHFRWLVRGIARDNALFEGSPLVVAGQVYIASIRHAGERCTTSVDCYPADETGPPPLRWRRELCIRDQKAGEPRYRHHLLTLAGSQLVYCSHSGAVIALDRLTGRTNWAIRYPPRSADRDEDRGLARPVWQDLAPVLFADGRLYVAPADSDRLLCLDPATGAVLWEREAMKVVHLLGVGQGRLIFTTCDGLRAVGAANGSDAAGWVLPDIDSKPPMGRGLLTGDLVLWPTMEMRSDSHPPRPVVYAVRQRDGRPAGDPALLHRLPAGNMAYANGCLAVADQHTLSVFVPPSLLPPRGKAAARRARQDALLEAGRRAAAAKQWQEAETALAQAAAPEFPARLRLHALTRAAQIWQEAGQPSRALQVWETIRAADDLRALQVVDKDGTPRSAADHAAAAIARFRPADPSAARAALRDLARRHEQARRSGAAAEAYRRLLAGGITGTEHAAALVGLARAYERQHCWTAARDAWQQLDREHGTETLPDLDPKRPVRDFVTDHLRGPPLAAPAQPEQLQPLFRTWHATLGSEEWVLCGDSYPDGELLLSGGPVSRAASSSPRGRLVCRSTVTGDVRWRQPLPFVPRWAGCLADLVLAGGERGVACLRQEDGQSLWHFAAPEAGSYPVAPLDGVRVFTDPQTPETLSGFQLAGGRLYFFQGQRRLFALDALAGKVLWHRWAPGAEFRLPYPQGRFGPAYLAGARTVLLQTTSASRWLLDAGTGQTLHQAPTNRAPWPRPPLALDDHTVCIVPDARHVVLLDALSGKDLWTHTVPGATTLSGEAPRVLGRGEALLLVTATNIGYRLQRLNRTTGWIAWPQSHLLPMQTLDTSLWTLDPNAVYSAHDGVLTARSLADGRVLWEQPLGADHSFAAWKVSRGAGCVVAHPVASAVASTAALFRFRCLPGSLQWDWGPSLAPGGAFPVVCCDPKTGQLIQRLNCRVEPRPRTTREIRRTSGGPGRSLVLHTSPLLASADGPVVRLSQAGGIVAVGGDVWGLSIGAKVSDAERR